MSEPTANERLLYAGRYLRFIERQGWEMISRKHAVVALSAWTGRNELLLVEQYRIPLGQRTIELPAGLVGDEPGQNDESLRAAAARELEEETGWRPGRLNELMRYPSSAGLTDEIVVLMQADELTQVGPGGGDDSEDIVVHCIAESAVHDWLIEQQARGLALDPKIHAALYWRQHSR